MKLTRSQLGAGLVVAALILVAVFVFFIKKSPSADISGAPTSNTNTNQDREFVPNPALEATYEQQVKAAIATFDNGAMAETVRLQLLDITVPDKYKNFHLDLVIVFDKLEAGRKAAAQEKIEAALNDLDTLRSRYPWLQ